jgi:hypothetical protein
LEYQKNGGDVLKLTAKGYLLYSLPFIVSVCIAFQAGILSVLGSFYGLVLMSIFTWGLPVIVFCFPYALYFYLLQKYLHVRKRVPITAFILTMVGFITVIVGVEHYYESFEKRIYFSKETTARLEERSLAHYKKEMGVKGVVVSRETTSAKVDWNEGDGTSEQPRTYDFVVFPKNYADGGNQRSQHYTYEYRKGKWVLKNKLE